MAKFTRTASTGWSGGAQFVGGSVDVTIDGTVYEGFSLIVAQFPGQKKRNPPTCCRASGLEYPIGTPIAFGTFPPEKRKVAVIYPQSSAALIVARAYMKRNAPIADDCIAALRSLDAKDLPADIAEAAGICDKPIVNALAGPSQVKVIELDKFQTAALEAF